MDDMRDILRDNRAALDVDKTIDLLWDTFLPTTPDNKIVRLDMLSAAVTAQVTEPQFADTLSDNGQYWQRKLHTWITDNAGKD